MRVRSGFVIPANAEIQRRLVTKDTGSPLEPAPNALIGRGDDDGSHDRDAL